MFKRKPDAALLALSDELDEYKRALSVTKDRAASILLPSLEDSPNPSDTRFYRFKKTFDSGKLSADCYTELNDFWGGDFFVCREVAAHRVCAALIEPAGKGPQAALVGSMLLGIVEAWLAAADFMNPGRAMEKLGSQLNQIFAAKHLHGLFACMTLVVIDTAKGQIWVSGRGNESLPVLRKNGNVATIPIPKVPPLGIMDDDMLGMTRIDTSAKSFKLIAGDTLVFYSSVFSGALLKSMLAAASKRGSFELPSQPGLEKPLLDLSALPDTMDIPERLSLALHAVRYRAGAALSTQPGREEPIKPLPLSLQKEQAQVLAKLLPELKVETSEEPILTIPDATYGVPQCPMVLCVRWG